MFREIPLSECTDRRGMKRHLIYGVGVNDAPYKTTLKLNGVTFTCPYYARWYFMMHRAYSKAWAKKHPTYEKCSVAPEWHSFMAFKAWMLQQDWKGKQLDKDLLSLGSGVYSPSTCLFVSPYVNSLFNERTNDQGELPLGIYGRKGKFEVGVSKGKGRTWVGAYNTVPEAIDAYLQAKLKVVQQAIANEPDPKVKQAIQNYSQYFADKLSRLKAAY